MDLDSKRSVNALSSIAFASKTVGNEKVPGLKNGMDYVKLGDSDLVVSKVCMGTVSNYSTLVERREIVSSKFRHVCLLLMNNVRSKLLHKLTR
jgi:hypothetical protein